MIALILEKGKKPMSRVSYYMADDFFHKLPPWLCMKRTFMMLIFGTKKLRNDIDVSFAPLIGHLKLLWERNVEIYDECRKKLFRNQTNPYSSMPHIKLFPKKKTPVNLHTNACGLGPMPILYHLPVLLGVYGLPRFFNHNDFFYALLSQLLQIFS